MLKFKEVKWPHCPLSWNTVPGIQRQMPRAFSTTHHTYILNCLSGWVPILIHGPCGAFGLIFGFFLFFSAFFFSGLHLWHMEVPRLRVQSELQPPAYTTATAMEDPSHVFDLHHSSRQCQSLNPLSKARDQTQTLMVPSWILFPLCHDRTSWFLDSSHLRDLPPLALLVPFIGASPVVPRNKFPAPALTPWSPRARSVSLSSTIKGKFGPGSASRS